MTTKASFAALALAVFALLSAPAVAADAEAGKRVFNKCKACHSLVAGKKKIGPSLHGVFGRTAGTLDGFKYSKAMRKAGEESKLVWTEETLDQYVTKPRKFIPKNKMAFAGLKKKTDRENLIAYLKEATK
jgi:cytochrome c2